MEGSTVVTDPVAALEEPEITSAMETGFGRGFGPAEWMGSNGSGGGDGGEASSPWSLTEEQQVCNLGENWIRFLNGAPKADVHSVVKLESLSEPWCATVVAKLRVDPCLDSCNELEIDDWQWSSGVLWFNMTSLDAAILMGNLKMVQKILETSSFPRIKQMQGPVVADIEKAFWRFFPIPSEKAITLYTPLHLAIASGDMDIVDVLLEHGANINGQEWSSQTPLDYACKSETVDLLLKLLAKDTQKRDPLHIAVRHGDIDFIKKLNSPNVNAMDHQKRTPLHYLVAYHHHNVGAMTSIVKYLNIDKKLDIKTLDSSGFTAFYVAILCCNTQFVIALLDSSKDQVRLNEACTKNLGPPIQIAFEGGDKFKDIEEALMECDPVKSFMERLYRDRQVYVDAANAILVGAALIASVTFASWLQPLLNYTSYSGEGYSSSSSFDLNYVDVEHNIPLRAFWIFNALSFYFAIATVVCGARSVLPRSHLFIKKTVEKLRINLLVTSFLLACSVLFVIIAFAIAGTIVLTPLLKYQWYMIVPTLIGGMVCIISLVFLVKNMVENSFDTCEYTNPFKDSKGKGYLEQINRLRNLEKIFKSIKFELKLDLELIVSKLESLD